MSRLASNSLSQPVQPNHPSVRASGLNIPVQPKRRSQTFSGSDAVYWLAQEAETGRWISSEESRWSEISRPVELNPGFTVYLSTQTLHTLCLGYHKQDIVFRLTAPTACAYFSFDRYGQCMAPGSDPLWLYSVYGYVLAEYVIAARIFPTYETEILCLPRPVAFPW